MRHSHYLVAAVIAASIAGTSLGSAQTKAPSADDSASADARSRESQDVKNLATQLDQLMKNTEVAKQQLDDGYKALADASKDMAGAEKFVDDKIATLRSLSDRIKPDSAFMKLFDDAEGVLRRHAQQEASSTDTERQEFAKPLNKLADQIAAARSNFREMYDNFSKEVDRLEKRKPIIEDLYLLNKGQEFVNESNKEYKIYQDLLGNMHLFGEHLIEQIAPNAPTQ